MIEWLLEGQREADIAAAIREKWPAEDCHALLVSAVEHFEAAASCDLAIVIGWALEAYKDLYHRQLADGDFPEPAPQQRAQRRRGAKEGVPRRGARRADPGL